MKNKIIFILCTIVILCVGSIVNASTTLKDIKDTKYEDSVNTLITLGVVNGYPSDNTYRPENVVTRAEMAKLMVVALGEEANVATAQKASQKFKDVTSKDWEYGYVNLAAELGVINGYPDGSFKPDNQVRYDEATAMMIRALGYEKAIEKRTEVWPNNYINQAKELSLYSSVGTINSSEGAKRGNIAILLWNMLRTGMCTVTGENDTGFKYEQGEKMINNKMTKFVYLENARVTDVEFDDDYEEAEVKIKGEKTLNLTFDALEAAQMYGRKFHVLYNTSTKKVEAITESADNNIKEGEIEEIKSDKIYIDGASSKGYELPDDDNILLYGIDDIDDAVSAILVLDGSKLEYVVAFAPEEVYLALVTDTDVTVSKKDGIKLVNYKNSTAKSYALFDEEDMPEDDDVILYYLNSDDEAIILKSTNVYKSKEIDSASSTKIKLEGTSYKLSDKEYQIVKVNTSSLKSMSVSDIEEDEDSISLMEFGGKRYFIVYEGGVEKAEEELADDMKSAINTLSNYMAKSAIKTALNNEIKYTQSTYANFLSSYNAAQTAIDNAKKTASATNLNKVKTAYTDLQETYKALRKISDITSSSTRESEEERVEAKVALRKIVNGTTPVEGKKVPTCVSNKSSYTTASYNTFNTALNTANTILKSTNASYTKIDNATTALKNAMNGLINAAEDEARKAAINSLNAALDKAQKVGAATQYDEESYNNFVAWWDEAKAINTKTATVEVISNTAKYLENAIGILDKNTDKVREELNTLLDTARRKLAEVEVYTKESYEKLENVISEAESAKSNLGADENTLKAIIDEVELVIEEMVTVGEEFAMVTNIANEYNVKIDITANDFAKLTYTQKLEKITSVKKSIESHLTDLIEAFQEQADETESKIEENEENKASMSATFKENIDIISTISGDGLKYVRGTNNVSLTDIENSLWQVVAKVYISNQYFIGEEDEEWEINSEFYDKLDDAVKGYANEFKVVDSDGNEVYIGHQNETKWGESWYTHFLRQAIYNVAVGATDETIDDYYSEKEFLKYYNHEVERLNKELSAI